MTPVSAPTDPETSGGALRARVRIEADPLPSIGAPMHACEACGQQLSEAADQCPRCGRRLDGHLHTPAISGGTAGHLQQASLTGETGRIPQLIGTGGAHATDSAPAANAAPDLDAATHLDAATEVDAATPAAGARDDQSSAPPRSPVSPDWDPDETTRFRPVVTSRRNAKNTAALIGLAISLIAAVGSLAWLIGQSVTAGSPIPRAPGAPTNRPTAASTALPRNATVCTTEVARSTNTSCTAARRVLAAVRTIGNDLPDSFRLIVVDPQTRKNSTYLCTIKGWIECVGQRDATVYVRREA